MSGRRVALYAGYYQRSLATCDLTHLGRLTCENLSH